MQPWADARRRENAAKYLHHNAACFLAGGLGTMYMANLYQFLQNPDYLVVTGEGLSAHPVPHHPARRTSAHRRQDRRSGRATRADAGTATRW